MPPRGFELLRRCSTEDDSILTLSGLSGIPTDSELSEELPFVVNVGSAPAISRACAAMRQARLPAGVLAFLGQPRLFVSSSRISAV